MGNEPGTRQESPLVRAGHLQVPSGQETPTQGDGELHGGGHILAPLAACTPATTICQPDWSRTLIGRGSTTIASA